MTDERLGKSLLPAIRRLPPGSGIVFRHYGTAPSKRRKLFMQIRHIAKARQLTLLLSGSPRQAIAWGADGVYGPAGEGLLHAASAHNAGELRAAPRADIVFISPVFATRTHPGAQALGIAGFRQLSARARGAHVIALGGMDGKRARRLGRGFAHGWAAIDAFIL